MKKIIFFTAFCFAGYFSNAQDSTFILKLAKEIILRDSKHITTIHRADGSIERRPSFISNSYDTFFKPIFGKVMLGNNDLVNQGSAYALAVDQLGSTFSINYNWIRNKQDPKKGYFNLGFAATSSSKLLPVFSKDQWQQGLGLSFGFTKPFHSYLSFKVDEQDFFLKRKQLLTARLKEVYDLMKVDTNKLKTEIAVVNSIDVTTNLTNLEVNLEKLPIKDFSDFASKQKQLTTIQSYHAMEHDNLKLTHYVDSLISDFESQYFKNLDYGFWWWNFVIRPEYKGVSIYDTLAAKKAGVQKKDYFRISIEGYINHVISNNNLFLFQIGTGLKNSNFLEGKKATEISFLQPLALPDTLLTNIKDVTIADNYDQYKKQFLLLTPVVGFDWFWGRKRMFGWETFYSTKLAFKKKAIPFDNLFTFRSGLLFSVNGKTDLAKSTFAFLVQWEDVKYSKFNIRDNFSLNLRIGIPFNN